MPSQRLHPRNTATVSDGTNSMVIPAKGSAVAYCFTGISNTLHFPSARRRRQQQLANSQQTYAHTLHQIQYFSETIELSDFERICSNFATSTCCQFLKVQATTR